MVEAGPLGAPGFGGRARASASARARARARARATAEEAPAQQKRALSKVLSREPEREKL